MSNGKQINTQLTRQCQNKQMSICKSSASKRKTRYECFLLRGTRPLNGLSGASKAKKDARRPDENASEKSTCWIDLHALAPEAALLKKRKVLLIAGRFFFSFRRTLKYFNTPRPNHRLVCDMISEQYSWTSALT